MAGMKCTECEAPIPDTAWTCPQCGVPVEDTAPSGREISPAGLTFMILLFIAFPVVLFLLHIFVPGF